MVPNLSLLKYFDITLPRHKSFKIEGSGPPFRLSKELFCFLFLFEAATQLVRRVQPKRTQVVCSNKVGRSCLAQRHSRNGPQKYEYSFDVYIHIFFFEVDVRIRRHTNKRGREQNTNEQ